MRKNSPEIHTSMSLKIGLQGDTWVLFGIPHPRCKSLPPCTLTGRFGRKSTAEDKRTRTQVDNNVPR